MGDMHMGPKVILGLFNGKVLITETVFWALIVAAVLVIFAVLSTRNLQRNPKGLQAVAELIVEKIYGMVETTMGPQNLRYAPYMGTLFMFLILGNMLGLFGFRPVTADVNTTFALAIITFLMIQYGSLKSKGVKGYFKHMAEPYAFMVPINLIEEVSFPISLAFRLFGNITGGVIIMDLVFMGLGHACKVLGLGIPLLEAVIPLPANFFFDIFEPILQAFIFTMLTMVFVSNAITIHEVRSK